MGTQNRPYVCDETAGRKALCACDRSQKMPYCDGSHKGSGLKPFIVELTDDRKVAWCGCGRSGNRPYCDGSHARP